MNSPMVFLKKLGGTISQNSPEILTGLGCAGVISTTVLAVRATPRALEILDVYEQRHEEFPSAIDLIKLVGPIYVPTIILGTLTIACIVGSNRVSANRNAALAAVYSLADVTFHEYREKVVETLGQKKEQKIRDEIDAEHLLARGERPGEIITTDKGDSLCYDRLSGRYFTSNYELIRQAVNDVNYGLRSDHWIDLNDLYYAMGLPPIELGYLVGFDIERGSCDPSYSSHLVFNNQPCLFINMEVFPKR